MLGSKLGGKVADAWQGEARRATSGIAAAAARVARAALVLPLLVLSLAVVSCAGGAAPALPDPGQNGIAFTVKSEPAGASVVVDGVVVGAAPVEVKLRPGPHRVHATMSGYYPAPSTRVQVGTTEPAEVTLHLVASH
ncbi:MAG: PEGA domain-containing protein [Deltaproteobacteria bacterium]|nr:PEGA domain-containing protein [Deltaproteobacteria bacterium]